MNKQLIRSIFIILFILSCDLGVVSAYDGIVISVLFSLLFPESAFLLLVAICFFQDSPGMSTWGWYLSFSIVFLILLNKNIYLFKKVILRNKLYIFSVSVVGYGLVASFVYDITGMYPQSDLRPYYLSGILMIVMITAGFLVRLEVLKKTSNFQSLQYVLFILISHALFIIIYQMFIDVTFLSSDAGYNNILDSAQLLNKTDAGFSRLTGTYNTPNGFGYCVLLALLLLIHSIKEMKVKYLLIYASIALFFAVAALSKGLIAFSLLSSAFYLFYLVKKTIVRYFISFILSPLILVVVMSPELMLNMVGADISSALRLDSIIDSQSLGYRSEAWSLILKEFSIDAWLLGTGISHWPIFFSSHLNFSLSDPHTMIYSYIGTFGLLGVLLFIYLIYLVHNKRVTLSLRYYFLSASLLSILLVKDLVSIPYVFGNTPISFLLWLTIFTLLYKPEALNFKQ